MLISWEPVHSKHISLQCWWLQYFTQKNGLGIMQLILSINLTWRNWANISNLAKQFRFFDTDILDELNYLPFPETRSALLFHIIKFLHEKTT